METKLKSDLNEELRKLFRTKVVDVHIAMLLGKLPKPGYQHICTYYFCPMLSYITCY